MDKAAKKAASASREISSSIKKEMGESKASMALLGEEIGVTIPRHLRGFINAIPGVSGALSAAFSGIAIIAMIEVLIKAGEQVKKLVEAYHEAGKKAGEMASAFSKVLEPLQETNDSLEVQKDKIQQSLDKLEKKPHNAIKDAIDEAILSADTLLKTLQASSEKISETLRKQASSTGGMFSGQESSKGVATGWDAYSNRMEMAVEKYRDQLAEAKGKGGNEDDLNKIRSTARQDLTSIRNAYVSEFQNGTRNGQPIANLGYIPYNTAKGLQDSRDKTGIGPSYTSLIQELGMVNTGSERQLRGALGQFELDDLKTKLGKGQASADTSKLADTNQMKVWDARLGDLKLAASMKGNVYSVSEIADYWFSKIPQARPNNEKTVKQNWVTPNNELTTAVGTNLAAQAEADAKAAAEAIKKEDEAAVKAGAAYSKTQGEIGKYNAELLKGIQYGEELATKTLSWQERTGQITQADAAMQLLNIHTAAYKDEMASLVDEQKRLTEWYLSGNMTDSEYEAKSGGNELAQQKLKGNYGLQNTEDLHNTQIQSASQGFHDFFNEFERDAGNAAKNVHQVLTTAMNGINTELGKAMMGQKTNWAGVGQSVGSSMIQGGLKSAEGGLMKAFGLGKADGSSRGAALWTKSADILADPNKSPITGVGIGDDVAKSGGFGSFLSGFLKHIPFLGFAEGGNPDPYKTSIVGEKGPELFTPRGVSGTITSNQESFGSRGGNGLTIGTVDARGANQVEVEERVRQGAIAAYNQAMTDAPRLQMEKSRRLPTGRR